MKLDSQTGLLLRKSPTLGHEKAIIIKCDEDLDEMGKGERQRLRDTEEAEQNMTYNSILDTFSLNKQENASKKLFSLKINKKLTECKSYDKNSHELLNSKRTTPLAADVQLRKGNS